MVVEVDVWQTSSPFGPKLIPRLLSAANPVWTAASVPLTFFSVALPQQWPAGHVGLLPVEESFTQEAPAATDGPVEELDALAAASMLARSYFF